MKMGINREKWGVRSVSQICLSSFLALVRSFLRYGIRVLSGRITLSGLLISKLAGTPKHWITIKV